MAIATVPTTDSSKSFQQWAGLGTVASQGVAAHSAHPLVRVGTVVVLPGDNTSVPLGGTFDVFYCRKDHILLIDITT